MITLGDVGGGGGEHDRLEHRVGLGGLQARRVQADRDEVGERAGLDPAGVVPAEARVVGRAAQQGARR